MSATVVSNATIHTGRPDAKPFIGDVAFEDGRIGYVGPSSGLSQGEVFDGTGKHLVPGLIDCHAHLFLNAGPKAVEDFMAASDELKLQWATRNAARLLASGVTTIREVAAPHHLMQELRRKAQAGEIPAPRIVAALANITTRGGHGHMLGVEADTVTELRAAAREQIDAGADLLKIMASGGVMTPGSDPMAVQYSSLQLRAVVQAAEEAGIPTAAHAHNLPAIRNSIEAGITSIEHGTFLDEPTAAAMIEHGVWLVPTLATVYFLDQNLTDAEFPAWARAKVEELRPTFYAQAEIGIRAGVRIAAGTDMGVQFVEHAAGTLARELALYVERGMSPTRALASATGTAAELLRIDGEVGTIEPGKVADLVLVARDPLKDPMALGRAERVWQAGRPITP